jgi:hypothetical protein
MKRRLFLSVLVFCTLTVSFLTSSFYPGYNDVVLSQPKNPVLFVPLALVKFTMLYLSLLPSFFVLISAKLLHVECQWIGNRANLTIVCQPSWFTALFYLLFAALCSITLFVLLTHWQKRRAGTSSYSVPRVFRNKTR